jgi:hypothetical protein
MSAVVPRVKVYLKQSPINNRPGMAGKIACIGAFDTEETNPVLCAGLDEAYNLLGDDTTFNGVSCLDKLFTGATSVLAVNTTTWTGTGDNKTANKELTAQKLSDALAKIKGEDFDILFVAENITDEAIVIIDAFLAESFEMKYPAGFVAGLTRSSSSAYLATAAKAGQFCYGIITQQFTVGGVEYSIIDSGAYYAGILAAMNVGNSMTMKTIPYVTAVNPELSFETGGNGKALLEAGLTTVKCQDRGNGRYVVVNSQQPNGYDLYINRVRDFVVKEMSLHQFLGERNRPATFTEIEHELSNVKSECVDSLDLLEDIQYTVTKKDAQCVDIYIDSLVFAGIITQIDVYVRVEVE